MLLLVLVQSCGMYLSLSLFALISMLVTLFAYFSEYSACLSAQVVIQLSVVYASEELLTANTR